MYTKLPDSLKAECMVRATVEDPEVQKARAEVVKTKSVNTYQQCKRFIEIFLLLEMEVKKKQELKLWPFCI